MINFLKGRDLYMTNKEWRKENKHIDAISPGFKAFHQEQRREKIKKILVIISNVILWLCAVSGSVFGILAYFK